MIEFVANLAFAGFLKPVKISRLMIVAGPAHAELVVSPHQVTENV